MQGIVTLKAWSRPDMLKEVLTSILDSYGAKKYKYFISLDNYDKTKSETINLVKQFKKELDISAVYHKQNLGCAGNFKYCYNYAFQHDNNYDYMIHLEDDTIVSKDFFLWTEWALEKARKDENIFAVCAFISKQHKPWYKSIQTDSVEDSFIADHFECQGGWAINRNIYDYIESLGGPFGIHGNANFAGENTYVNPEIWKSKLLITDKGSWAWPMNKYFRRDKKVILPMISRGNNIGNDRGVFNVSKEWHQSHIWDDTWIDTKEIDTKSINYRLI